MARKVIEIVDGVARHPDYRMAEPVNFVLYEGEQLAILGPNGSGKTKLVNTIIGRYPLLMNEVHYDFGEYNHRMVCENIHYMAFRDGYGDADGFKPIGTAEKHEQIDGERREQNLDHGVAEVGDEMVPKACFGSLTEHIFAVRLARGLYLCGAETLLFFGFAYTCCRNYR